MVKPVKGTYEVELSVGLRGQDDNLDILNSLFEQLQVATVEAADPHLDLLTFAESAYYFAVISEHYVPPSPELEVDENDLDSWAKRMKLARKVAKAEKRARLKKAAEEKAEIERLLKNLAERKGVSLSIPLQPSRPPTSAPAAELEQEPLFDFEEELEEGTRSQQSTSTTTVAPNDWGKLGYSEAIGINLSSQQLTFDEKQRDQHQAAQWRREFMQRSQEQHTLSTPALPTHDEWRRDKAIGIVYLTTSHNMEDPLHVGELNIGIILAEDARGKGYARRAVEIVATKAFEEAKCHRLQAILLNHVAKDRALCLFTEMRFGHEGTRRRSFFSPMEQEWKDVTYMAIIDTDWVLSKSRDVSLSKRSAPKSLWDELFARHQREREELLRWESTANGTLRRSSSTATLRPASPPTALPITSESEAESEMSDSYSSPRLSYSQKGKRKAVITEDILQHRSNDGYDASTSDSEAELSPSSKKGRMSLPVPESPNPFTDDEKDGGSGGYDSVSSWDALELSASSSDDTSDSEDSSMYDFADGSP